LSDEICGFLHMKVDEKDAVSLLLRLNIRMPEKIISTD